MSATCLQQVPGVVVGAGRERLSSESMARVTQTGLHLVWWSSPDRDVTARLRDSRTTELGLRPITAFSRRVRAGHGVVIGFSALDETDMETLTTWPAQS